MPSNLEHKEWKGTTGGLPWMQRTLVKILAVVDVRIVYTFVAIFVIPFYMIFTHYGYIAQYHFFREVFKESWLKAFWHVYRNECKFSEIIIDRFAVFGGKKFNFEIPDYDKWQELERATKGFVQISAHVGNYEMAGYSLKVEHKKFHALVFSGETKTVMTNRAKVFVPNNIDMIPVAPDMSHVFALNNALSGGDIVSMPGDRVFGSKKSLTSKFFDKDAEFPVGPFSLAVLQETPIITVFVMKKDYKTYFIDIKELKKLDNTSAKRAEQLQYLVDQYAQQLEKIVRTYPLQWFNYFDFWRRDDK